MPILDGYSLLKKIREIRPEAKAILSSGYEAQNTCLQHCQDTTTAFLEKPYLAKELARKVREVLGAKTVQLA